MTIGASRQKRHELEEGDLGQARAGHEPRELEVGEDEPRVDEEEDQEDGDRRAPRTVTHPAPPAWRASAKRAAAA